MASPIEDKVIELLQKTSLSISELARQCGVTRGSVQHWARKGKISKENLTKLCSLLNVDITLLLSEVGADRTFSLKPLQERAIYLIRTLPDSDYYKLEESVKLLDHKVSS